MYGEEQRVADTDSKSKKFDIDGSSYNGQASNSSVLGNWWSHKILQADTQISPVSGSVKEQVVTFLEKMLGKRTQNKP